MSPNRISKRPTDSVRYWKRTLELAARGKYIRPASDQMLRLAALVALVGTSVDEDAQRVCGALSLLFLDKRRLPRWAQALEAIEPELPKLLRAVECLDAYRRANGINLGNFQLDKVVTVMMQVRDPNDYVAFHGAFGDCPLLGALFHPNTFARYKKRRRGTYGRATDAGAHADQRKRKVKVVE